MAKKRIVKERKIVKGMKEENREQMRNGKEKLKNAARRATQRVGKKVLAWGMYQEAGIDGILVTVGLCIIALILCVVMKDSLKVFIETLVTSMTNEAQNILNGVA